MALVQGDVVSPHLESGTVKAQPQPPTFGRVDDAPGDIDVIWEGGTLVSGIDGSSLDKILPVSVNALSGQRVFVNLAPTASVQASADFQGIVLNQYQRDQNGGGSPTANLALVKLLSSEAYLEVLATQCTPVLGGS